MEQLYKLQAHNHKEQIEEALTFTNMYDDIEEEFMEYDEEIESALTIIELVDLEGSIVKGFIKEIKIYHENEEVLIRGSINKLLIGDKTYEEDVKNNTSFKKFEKLISKEMDLKDVEDHFELYNYKVVTELYDKEDNVVTGVIRSLVGMLESGEVLITGTVTNNLQ